MQLLLFFEITFVQIWDEDCSVQRELGGKVNEKININSGLRERTDKDEFVYICNCVFYIWHTGISYLISLNPMLFKNIAHVGSFKYFLFVYSCICVFMYLCICVFYIW